MNLFNCTSCAREYIFWIHISLDSVTTQMISNGNFLHYLDYQKKSLYHLPPNLYYVKIYFSIMHLIMSLSAHWSHKWRSHFKLFLQIFPKHVFQFSSEDM